MDADRGMDPEVMGSKPDIVGCIVLLNSYSASHDN